MEQKSGGIDVEASGLDVVIRAVTGQQEVAAPAYQRPQNRHRPLGLAVSCFRTRYLELALSNADIALEKEFLVYLVAGIQATGFQGLFRVNASGKCTACAFTIAGWQVAAVTERGQCQPGLFRQLGPGPPVNLRRRGGRFSMASGPSEPQRASHQQ